MQQQSNTDDMIFGIAEIIAYMSRYMTLRVGDIIATGTPEGVGLGQQPPRFLNAGDEVRLGIDGLGEQCQVFCRLTASLFPVEPLQTFAIMLNDDMPPRAFSVAVIWLLAVVKGSSARINRRTRSICDRFLFARSTAALIAAVIAVSSWLFWSSSGAGTMTADNHGLRSPKTTTCSISGCRLSAASTRDGAILSPPELTIISFARPVMVI